MNVVISGAGKGIGFELAKAFVSKGHKTIAISRNTNGLLQLSSKHLKIITFDLVSGDFRKLEEEIKSVTGTIDILINNAGALVNKSISDFTETDFDLVFNTNVKAIFKLTQLILPYFSKNAHIVNISSMGGVQGSAKFPGLSLYSASKGAVSILTECLSEELKQQNISVNALALGAVQTEMLKQAFPDFKAPVSARQMADFIFDFSLNGNKYFNGKVLPVSLSTP